MGKQRKQQEQKSKTIMPSAVSNLPALPSVDAIVPEVYRGPTDFSNWVIPNRLLVGSYPRSKMLRNILDVGVSLFVNLVMEKEIQRYGSYIENAHSKAPKNSQLSYIHFPIYDHGIGNDKDVCELIVKLEGVLINSQTVIYMHCMGGHGRTGTLVSLLLARLYRLDSQMAMQYCQLFHDTREQTNGLSSPESSEQRSQIHKLIPKLVVEMQ